MSAHKCEESVRVPGRWPRFNPCGKSAKVENNGKWYCGIHSPDAVAARRAKSDAKWQANRAAMQAQSDLEAERKRRAECYPDLLAACEAALEAMLRNDFGTITLAPQLRAAIAKAKGQA